MHGIRLGEDSHTHRPVVRDVVPGSPAEQSGVKPGLEIESINGIAVKSLDDALFDPRGSGPNIELASTDGRKFSWSADWPAKRPPERSLPVHPVQIYSAIQSGLLCLLLWSFYPFRRCDGQVMALLLTLYPIGRFLEEMIRDDEVGRFGTPFTISQLISMIVFAIAVGFWAYLWKQPTGSVLPPKLAANGAAR
jgi:phosphatidylglycerol---prolipoprotein diacylglyceryl transferase